MTITDSKNAFAKKLTKGSIFAVFGVIYCLISLVNHYTFKTYAYDLGINNNALFDYSHLRWNDNTLLPGEQFNNILSDHLSLYPILVSPLYFIFGSYTMLVFQIAALLIGGLGIFKLIRLQSQSETLALLAVTGFFSMWGIYSALSFDYHDNVVASMFIPWLFYFLLRADYLRFFLTGLLIMIGKENMALWLVFTGLAIAALNFRDRSRCFAGLGLMAFAAVYFYAAISWIIPSFSNAGRGYLHFNFIALGTNFKEALQTVLTNPLYAFKLLYINHLGQPEYEGIKAELHKMVFLSGGILLLLRPAYFIILLPVYAQKLYNDDFSKWGINGHYSIEFVPILIIGAFDVIQRYLKKENIRHLAGVIVVLSTMKMTTSTFENRVSKWHYAPNVTFYKESHYTADFNIPEMYRILKMVPENAPLSASEILVAHVANRDTIYQFPDIKNAKYVLVVQHSRNYPLAGEQLVNECNKLKADPNWKLILDTNNTYLFRKSDSSNVYYKAPEIFK